MTKLFLTLALLFAGYVAQAQCDDYIVYTEDPINGNGNWGGNDNPVFSDDNKEGFVNLLLLSVDTKSVIWVITSTKFSCVDDNAGIEILFTDGSKTAFTSNNKFNCKGKTTSYFGHVFRKNDIAKELSTKMIKMIRVSTKSDIHSESVNEKNALLFMNIFNCLLEKQNSK